MFCVACRHELYWDVRVGFSVAENTRLVERLIGNEYGLAKVVMVNKVMAKAMMNEAIII